MIKPRLNKPGLYHFSAFEHAFKYHPLLGMPVRNGLSILFSLTSSGTGPSFRGLRRTS